MVQCGININPRVPNGQPSQAALLSGLTYVRLVFIAEELGISLDQALDYYEPLIKNYLLAGVQTLLVLNHQTILGNRPWDNGDYTTYAPLFAAGCQKIAQRLSGNHVAYEIWNEGDMVHGSASKYIPPASYAPLLDQAAASLRSADPQCLVILGGLASGTPIEYVQAVRAALHGNLPVNAIGLHPYGAWPPNFVGPLPFGGWFGPLKPGLDDMINAFPTIPIWITEVGIAEDVPLPASLYDMAQKYMQGVFNLVHDHFDSAIPVVIWFAWSDQMRNAGIVDSQNNPKQPIYQTFFTFVKKGSAPMPYNLKFQKDVTIPDDMPVAPGQALHKNWQVQNSGAADWQNCTLAFVSGEKMGAPDFVPIPFTKASASVDITVDLVAPSIPGRYRGVWQAQDPSGTRFGQQIWVQIQVKLPGPQVLLNVVIDFHQDNRLTDIDAMKQDGIKAIIHKASEGTYFRDNQYKARRSLADAGGFLWGAYHLASDDDVIEQATMFLEQAQPDDSTLVALDLESLHDRDNPTINHGINLRNAEQFATILHDKLGRWPLVYSNRTYLNGILGNAQSTILTNCPLWVASYVDLSPDMPHLWQSWKLWQYTDGTDGPAPRSVRGISLCDRNLFDGSLSDLIAFWHNAGR